MNKRIIIIATSVLTIALVSGLSFWFLTNKEGKTQEVPSGLTTSKKEKTPASSTTEETTTDSSSSEQAIEETEPTSIDVNYPNYQILDNLEAIKSEIKKLHDFSNGTTEYWEGVRKALKDTYGVSVSDNTKGGFGMFDVSDGEQENVLSGIVMSIEYEKLSEKQVKFRVVTRTGRAGVVDGDLSYTAKEVQKAIKRDGQDVTVDYQLNVSDDGKTGELIWLAGNWW